MSRRDGWRELLFQMCYVPDSFVFLNQSQELDWVIWKVRLLFR